MEYTIMILLFLISIYFTLRVRKEILEMILELSKLLENKQSYDIDILIKLSRDLRQIEKTQKKILESLPPELSEDNQ